MMEVEQAPPDPAPRPRRQICFCCGRRYGARQLARHRELYLNAEFAAAAARGVEFEGEGPEFGGDGMRMDDIDMEDGGDAVHDGEDNADPFANLALDHDHDPPAPPPGPMQANEILRNPPVHINDWPEPGSEGELEDYEEYEGPDNDPNEDPPYVERHVEPGQLGLNLLDEPGMADAQLRELMEADLGDLADEVWLELCEYLNITVYQANSLV
ncbi:hypothetical protein FS749_006339 [Ceratobasidium sp. UAMH 11750]|nr:hypothetical protein FS749_006339 [Ceratobasidium sp. UAMH 11750]